MSRKKPKSDDFTMKELLTMSYSKLNQLGEDVIEIKIHLKELNGKVGRNISDIEQNVKGIDSVRKEVDGINVTIAKWAGVFIAISSIVTIAINAYF